MCAISSVQSVTPKWYLGEYPDTDVEMEFVRDTGFLIKCHKENAVWTEMKMS